MEIMIDLTKKKCDKCGKDFNTRRRYLNHLKKVGYITTLNGRRVRIKSSD